jgi:signal peptidase II
MSSSLRRWLLLIIIATLVLLVDQVTKRIVVDTLAIGQSLQPIPQLAPFFQITYSQNSGAAFGFLPQAGDLFLILAVLIIIGMIFVYPRLPDKAILSRIGFGLVGGGALGNALDRLEYSAVIDFIHYTIPGIISNVSNIADHAIVFGVLLLVIDSWRTDDKRPANSETTPQEGA